MYTESLLIPSHEICDNDVKTKNARQRPIPVTLPPLDTINQLLRQEQTVNGGDALGYDAANHLRNAHEYQNDGEIASQHTTLKKFIYERIPQNSADMPWSLEDSFSFSTDPQQQAYQSMTEYQASEPFQYNSVDVLTSSEQALETLSLNHLSNAALASILPEFDPTKDIPLHTTPVEQSYVGTQRPLPIMLSPLKTPRPSKNSESELIQTIFKIDFNDVTVIELKTLLRQCGASATGKKTDLIERLKAVKAKMSLHLQGNQQVIEAVRMMDPASQYMKLGSTRFSPYTC
jgi:hypothetical protein